MEKDFEKDDQLVFAEEDETKASLTSEEVDDNFVNPNLYTPNPKFNK